MFDIALWASVVDLAVAAPKAAGLVARLVEPRHWSVILGPSGAGKSAIADHLCGDAPRRSYTLAESRTVDVKKARIDGHRVGFVVLPGHEEFAISSIRELEENPDRYGHVVFVASAGFATPRDQFAIPTDLETHRASTLAEEADRWARFLGTAERMRKPIVVAVSKFDLWIDRSDEVRDYYFTNPAFVDPLKDVQDRVGRLTLPVEILPVASNLDTFTTGIDEIHPKFDGEHRDKIMDRFRKILAT